MITRRLRLFGIVALLMVAGRVAQAQTVARSKEQVPPVKPQKAEKAAASPASIDAELDRLQRQVDDLRRQLAALRQVASPVPAKP